MDKKHEVVKLVANDAFTPLSADEDKPADTDATR